MNPDYLRDLFSSFRPITVRRMFGGAGIYADGVMFALLAGGALYLKADETNACDFEREGLPPFSYEGRNGKRAVMSHRRMPDRLYDDPDELAQWAGRALAVAQRKSKPKHQSSPKPRTKSALTGRPAGKRRR